ncbi:MAG: arylsulfatase A-like enzyme [Porticoccaceae bacterium]|jgi:arylsulfatase A-like enzyme
MRLLILILTLVLLDTPAGAQTVPAEDTHFTHRPNVLIIVADDLGYTDIGAFGGEINTPNIDRLASEGLRLSNFHVLPTCAPTRSVLLTGVDNHTAGIGSQIITAKQQGKPGYEGFLRNSVATIPEILSTTGYRTYQTGKWHLGNAESQSPFARGFQETFALLPGGASHFSDQQPLHPAEPVVYRRNGKIVDELPEDFYSTQYYTDMLLSWMERDKDSGQPFFAYLAYTAPHNPLHAPVEYIKKYSGRYDAGYEVLREARFAALKAQGLIPQDQEIAPWPTVVQRWNDLSTSEKANEARNMEIYAAMIDYMDEQIGHVYQWLQDNGELENTIIVFLSDNGASGLPVSIYPTHTPEFHARFDDSLDNRGASGSFVTTSAGWATASTAAFRLFKGFSTEGGIRTPAIIRPAGSPLQQNSPVAGSHKDLVTSDQFVHVRDFMPTMLDLAETQLPATQILTIGPLSGKSLTPLLDDPASAVFEEEEVGYELHGTRAFISGDWKALKMPVPTGSGEWQLFNVKTDPGEARDLAVEEHEILDSLIASHEKYERSNGVIVDYFGIVKTFNTIYVILDKLLYLFAGLLVLTLALKRNKIAFVLFASSVLNFAVLQLLESGWLLRVGL